VQRGKFTANDDLSLVFPNVAEVKATLLSCVADTGLENKIKDYFKEHAPQAEIFTARVQKQLCSICCAYKDVKTLGVDRWLAMIAGHQRVGKKGVVVIDCGSAITIDYVNSKGQHLGGYILPGIELLSTSLKVGTERVNFELDGTLGMEPGRSTEQCVNHGIRMMLVASINSALNWARRNGLENFLVTGGDAHLVNSYLGKKLEYQEDIVFEGLAMVYDAQKITI
jgi:type III pantothenate kinase